MYLFIYIFRRFLIIKKTILPALVGNEMIIANLALMALVGYLSSHVQRELVK